jgi:hypothetical protein
LEVAVKEPEIVPKKTMESAASSDDHFICAPELMMFSTRTFERIGAVVSGVLGVLVVLNGRVVAPAETLCPEKFPPASKAITV